MSDFHLVDPQGWEYDLQSVYSAYMGHFQLHAVPWHDRTWGQLFETFDQFLAFSWPVVTVTDARTGRAHIVTRMTSITAFLKMIKTRFGETLPQVDNVLLVTPFETSQRHLRHVSDWSAYKKLHSALPVIAQSALKARVRAGDPKAIRELWAMRDKTFLAIDFERLERDDRSCVEWGYAAIRSSLLEAAGVWPPVPDANYRCAFSWVVSHCKALVLSHSSKGHYIVSEYADKFNKAAPSLSWQYAFGDSQAISKTKMPCIIQSILSGLVSPDSETVANNVVLVGHGVQAIMQRLDEMKIKLPNNMLILDIAYFERALFTTGERGPMVDRKTGRARLPESLLSLGGIMNSLGIDVPCALHNAGNDAFMSLVAFQWMVDPKAGAEGKVTPKGVGGKGKSGHVRRAATVAARLFRPLGGTRPDLELSQKKQTALGKNASVGHGTLPTRAGRPGGDGVDEMGMKRASVFRAFTPPLLVPTDKNKKRASSNGSSSGSGAWLSPLTVPQKRHSVNVLTEKRR
ncbi:hypothetical protein OG21DRAFT_1605510 [Imleria badia]|nr:hypothetical protein OG21DRAFT_1605510 [Imleria badia]